LSFVSRKTLHEIRFTLYALNLARIIHDSSTAIADPLLRQACGRRARSSDLRRTARVRRHEHSWKMRARAENTSPLWNEQGKPFGSEPAARRHWDDRRWPDLL